MDERLEGIIRKNEANRKFGVKLGQQDIDYLIQKVQEAEKRNERLKTRRDHLAHRLKIRREENQQYKECEKWLLRIRAEASLQEYPPAVLEYAVAEPEGIYDMVVYLISQKQRYKEVLEEVRELTRFDDGTEEQVYLLVDKALKGETNETSK